MKKGIFSLVCGVVGSLALVGLAPTVSADAVMVSGHMCTGYAPHNQDRYLRFRDGGIQNQSIDKTIKVSCPIHTDLNKPAFDLIVRPTNMAGYSQQIYCDLRELDLGDWVQRNTRRSKRFPPQISDGLLWEGITRSDSYNRFDLVCTLPPLTAIGLIGMD